MQTFIETEQKRLIKKFHTLLGKASIGYDGKEAILSAYNVESSKDLTVSQLWDVCKRIDELSNPEAAEMDKARKRVIKILFVYCELVNRKADMNYVKGIACRAAGYDYFNKIPLKRLTDIYNDFTKRVKVIKNGNSIAKNDLLNIISLN